jgi:hypothetical protein
MAELRLAAYRLAGFAVCLLLGCATPIEERRWHRVTTPHFELVSGADERRSLEIAARLLAEIRRRREGPPPTSRELEVER